ncbi:restriction endonuclease subunit S [Acinetobacter lwoffii]|uniref:restriction endonuclease subunit S n=1 Tax=Acinetobacter lwoffii TaxID=28090 RepID=UPI00110CFF84|nr:restriction endonuclease subunit S [Acinetobacter lwoffii]TMS45871.1 restriction endonuclease subunit S [Acinetobacter lwoffii]
MSDWVTAKLKEVAKVVTGKTPQTSKSEYYGGNIPFVSPADLNEGILSETKTYLTSSGADQVYRVPKNTVLVSCIGNLGKLAITSKEVCFNQQINGLIFDEQKIFPKYGFYCAQTLKPQLEKASSSTTLPIVNKSRFSDLEIQYPPLAEQRRIASILDKADELRQKRQQAIEKLDQLLQATFIDMFGDPVLNNKKFPTKTLGELGGWSSGGTPSRTEPSYFKGEIPWYTSGELNAVYIEDSIERISELALDKSSAKLIPIGSLLVGMYDTAAFKSSITTVPSACNQAIAFGQLNSNLVNTLYIYYCIQLSKDSLKKMQRGVRQKNLNLSMIKSISIPFPDIKLQNKFSEISTKLMIQRGTLEQSSDNLDSLFKSLQDQAFSGNL